MLELKSTSIFQPDKPEKIYQGRLFYKEEKLCLEILDFESMRDYYLFSFVKIFYLTDNETNKKYSLLNLFVKSFGINRNVEFRVNELYEGDWITNVKDKKYNQCIVQMSGLALFIDYHLTSAHYESGSHLFKIQEPKEFSYKIDNTHKLTLRKFYQYEQKSLSVIINERASIIIETTKLTSRFELLQKVKSFNYFLSILLPNVSKIWEIEYRNKKKSSVKYINEDLYKEEVTSKSEMAFTLHDFPNTIFKNWNFKQNILNEISELLIAARENIVAETAFTYCTKALELCFKNLFLANMSELSNVKNLMIQEKVWDNDWQLPKKIGKTNFGLMLCSLWNSFNCKDVLEPFIVNPYKFLKKVHSSRNYYTHRSNKINIFTESQLVYVNNTLKSFAYGLILQFIGMETKKIEMFVKRYNSFLFSLEYDKNEYSINYKDTKDYEQ